MHARKLKAMIFFGLVSLAVAGCSLKPQDSTPTVEAPTRTTAPTAENTPLPSLTPTEQIIYVAVVNGESVRQSSFDASLLQLQQAMAEFPELFEGDLPSPQERVLEELVNRVLLSQAARQAGFVADQQLVSERLARLTAQVGGEQALNDWLEKNGYTMETFLLELPLEIEAAWQRDQIASTVPERMEQVKARQLLFYDPFQASRAYDQLQAGISIDAIIENNDPNDLGYLDWFPRGILLVPELDQVAFSLAPGQYSEVIQTDIGYHILYVIDKDPAHPLSSEVRLILEERAVADWLAQQRSQASVESLLP
jgi:peptidyl-prolyl cis-trans isomerase C